MKFNLLTQTRSWKGTSAILIAVALSISSACSLKMKNNGSAEGDSSAASGPPIFALLDVIDTSGYVNSSTVTLNVATSGSFTHYCIQANDNDLSNCAWVASTVLPSTFDTGVVNGNVTLSGWLRNTDLAVVTARRDAPPFTVDQALPAAATAPIWSETSPHNSTSVTPTWTKSVSADLDTQRIQFYSDASCTSTSGTSIDLNSDTAQTYAWTAPSSGTYTYKITSVDHAQNSTVSACSTAMVIDTAGPANATSLAWAESSPRNNLAVNAQWVKSVSGDLANQKIQFYSDASCSTTSGAEIDLASSAVQIRAFNAPAAGTYTYKITSVDTAGNSSASACSSAMVIDQTAPSNATALAWTETSPHGDTSVSASWTKSASGDLANQKLQFYSDASCTTTSGGEVDLSSSSAQTYAWTAPSAGTFAYTLTSVDTAGNSATSGCSSSMVIDMTGPNNATALGWSETSPHNDLSVTAAWTKSNSVDLANQKVQFYADGSCTTASGALIDLSSAATQTYAWTAPAAGTYSYKVTSLDGVGNSSVSGCSSSMLIDTAPPAAATSLAWVEVSPHGDTSVSATWTKSVAGDLADQKIQFYSDASCSTTSGALVDLTSADTTYAWTAPGSGTFAYVLVSVDTAGNTSNSACSASMQIDTGAPENATALAWSETSPHGDTSITAAWTKSIAGDLGDQTIQFYSDASCTTTSGASIDLTSASQTYAWTAPSDGTFSYKVTSIDTSLNSSTSACSASMVVDSSGPAAATALGWSETSPHGDTSITAAWTKSVDAGLSNQKIQFYSDASCTTTSGALVDLASAATQTYAWTAPSTGDFTYKITSIDAAANETVSGCSSVMNIDTAPPAGATLLGWSESSPENSTSVTAAWTKSVSADLGDQKIQFYSDASCSTTSGGLVDLTSADSTYAWTAPGAGTFAYVLVSVDNAGNSTNSTCSSSMVIDLTDPANATALGWTETSPHGDTSVSAAWTKSVDGALADQFIQFYSDASCTTTSGAEVDLTSASTTYAWTAPGDGTFTYKVRSVDTAGNDDVSACSASMVIDSSGPANATNLAWSETSPHGDTSITADWDPSADVGLTDQKIQFYSDASCTTASGAEIDLTSATSSYAWTAPGEGSFSYKITSVDSALNSAVSGCSAGMVVDSTDPAAATALGWVESTPENSTSVNASWTKSTDGALADQFIQFYSDAGCSTASGAEIDLTSASTSYAWTAPGAGSFKYTVRSVDTAGNDSVSACSSAMVIDLTDPANATALGWSETSPHGDTSITAAWTKSTDGSLGDQFVQFYSDASCTTTSGAEIDLTSAATTYAWTAPGDGTFAYKVRSVDTAGNDDLSACSASMQVDGAGPSAATALGWTETSPHADTSITASWTKSASGDLANQKIQFYSDTSCSTTSGALIDLASTATQSYAWTAPSAGDFTYKVTSIDSALNETVSACSSSILIDTAPPAAATALGWSQTSPENSTSVTAAWTKSVAADLGDQKIQFYSDASCSTTSGGLVDLTSADSTYAWTAPGEGTFAYVLVSVDNAGNSTNSACSSSMVIDLTDPANATALGWSETSPHGDTSITAAWTKSTDGALGDQSIQYYSDASCTTASGASVDLTSADATHSWSAPSDGTYTYKVTSVDTAGNDNVSACSASMVVDSAGPSNATGLGWTETSPENSTSVNASWTKSADGSLNDQFIQFYSDASCSTTSGAEIDLTTADQTYAWTAPGEGTFAYKIRSVDNLSNSSTSACSSSMVIDTTAPANATALAWSESSPHGDTSITAAWTKSVAADLGDQSIQFYSDASCTTTSGAVIDLTSASTTYAWTAPAGGTYAYKVTSVDTAGNSANSACSASMTVDLAPPAAATALGWTETSPHGDTSVQAAWTKSAAGDLANQKIQFYSDGSCSTTSGALVDLASSTDQTYSWTAPGEGTYSYKITSLDGVGNSQDSACSASMVIDSSGPANATNLAWSETSPHGDLTLTADWDPSNDAGLSDQKIQFYSDSSCTTTSGAEIDLTSASTTYAWTAPAAGTFAYKITSVDAALNTAVSGCSAAMVIDMTDPANATALGWSESTPENSTSVTAAWTKSNDAGLADQFIQFYSDAGCTTTSGAEVDLTSASTTYAWTAPGAGTFAYKVRSLDSAGNDDVSACSASMVIDLTDPANATALGWTETSPHGDTSVAASWTKSTDGALADQFIQFYSDASCTTTSGAEVDLTSAATSYSWTAPGEGTFAYKVRSLDTAGNDDVSACSASMVIDSSGPANATNLAWSETSPHGDLTLTADWDPSNDAGLSDQKIQFYSDSSCSTTSGAEIDLTSASSSYAWTAPAAGTFAYKITSVDAALNTAVSGCSAAMVIDMTDPANATALGWSESTPENSTSVTAAWTKSNDAGLADQFIQFYSDASCSTTSGAEVDLTSASTTYAWTAPGAGTFAYTVRSLDSAGNDDVSACSASMVIDLTDPANATALGWTETSPHGDTSVAASWTKSTDGALADQFIQFYSDAACTTTSGAEVDLTSAATSYSWTAPGEGTFAYKVRSLDTAGNDDVSACSASMVIDTTGPTNATNLGWMFPSPQGGLNITADWDKSTDASLANQKVQFYSDGTCTTAVDTEKTANTFVSAYSWNAPSAGTYTYKVFSLDAVGNRSESGCSSAMVIDLTPPTDPTSLVWSPTTPSNTLGITASWTKSVSADLNDQLIQFYSDASCTTTSGALIDLTSATQSYAWTAPGVGTYTYKITSVDTAGGNDESDCSSSKLIDQTDPDNATALGWNPTSPEATTSVTASWTKSASGDLANQKLQFYSDNTCSTTSGAEIDLSSSATQTYNWTAPGAGSFAYKVTSIDSAGNDAVSGCSGEMVIDLTGPTAPTVLGWSAASPENTTSVTAAWTKSADGDLNDQSIQFYSDSSCTTTQGAAIDLTGASETYAWTAPGAGTFAYKIISYDTLSNSSTSGCSSAMVIDLTDPANATSLGWSESSPRNSTSVTAAWTKSTDGSLADQFIQYYSDASCTTTSGAEVDLTSASTTHSWTAPGAGTFAYKIRSVDTAGNDDSSACSSSMVIDQTDPANATALAWTEGTISPDTSVQAAWTKSADAGLSNQFIQFYSNAGCTVTEGSEIDLASSSAQVYSWTAPGEGSFKYKIRSVDQAGNDDVSACSSAMQIDLTNPANATALAWDEASPHADTSITAEWTVSNAADLADQKIQFYSGASCSATSGAEIDLNSASVSYAWTAPADGIYGFKIISVDNAGRTNTSNCSSDMEVDSGGGNTPTKLAFSVQPSNANVGVAISPAIKVEIRDASNALVATATDNVTLSIGTNPGGANIAGTVTVAAVAGVATFNNISLNQYGVGYTLTATSGSLTAAHSSPFNITYGTANKLAFTATSATTGPIYGCSGPFVVQVQDSSNAPVAAGSNITVTLAESGAGAGTFYTDAGCASAAVSSVILPSGSLGTTFYLRHDTAETINVTANDGAALTDASRSVTISSTNLATNLQVPIDLSMKGLAGGSPSGSQTTFESTRTYIDPADFDGNPQYYLEVVVANSDAASKTITLANSANGDTITIAVPGSTTRTRMISSSFTPSAAAWFFLKLDNTDAINAFSVYSARILVNQTAPTKTRIYFPFITLHEGSPSSTDSYATNTQGTTAKEGNNGTVSGATLLFKKYSAGFKNLKATNPWRLEGVLSSSAGTRTASMEIYNLSTSTATTATVSTTSTTPVGIYADFADNLGSFTDGSTFIARHKSTNSTAYAYVYAAKISVALDGITRAQVPYSLDWPVTVAAENYLKKSRTLLNFGLFSNPRVYFEAAFGASTQDLSAKLYSDGNSNTFSNGSETLITTLTGAASRAVTQSNALTVTGNLQYVNKYDAVSSSGTAIYSRLLVDTTADSAVVPSLASATITNGSTTSSRTFNLSYGAITGTYDEYCILENSNVVGGCTWVTGALPSSYTVTATEEAKTLSIWIKNSAGTSTRVDAGPTTFSFGTSGPILASLTVTNSSPTNALVYNLTWGGITGSYTDWCILENSTNVASCVWQAGAVQPTYTTSGTNGAIALTAFVRNAYAPSPPITSNSVTLDTVGPSITLTQPNGGETLTGGNNYSVLWSASDATTSVAANSIVVSYSSNSGSNYTTISSGEANDGTYTWAVMNVATTQGRVRIAATDAAGNTAQVASAADFTVNYQALPATQLVFTQNPTNADAGANISPSMTVEVRDATGARVTGSTASVTLAFQTNAGSGTLSGTVTRSAVAGIATFNDIWINKAATGYVLKATSAGLTDAVSTSFNISALTTVTQLGFSASSSSGGMVSTCVGPFTVEKQDAYGNPITPSNVTITVSENGTGTASFYAASDCSGGATNSYAINAGTSSATFYMNHDASETITLTADDGGALTNATKSVTISVPYQTDLLLGMEMGTTPNNEFLTSGPNGTWGTEIFASSAAGTYYTGRFGLGINSSLASVVGMARYARSVRSCATGYYASGKIKYASLTGLKNSSNAWVQNGLGVVLANGTASSTGQIIGAGLNFSGNPVLYRCAGATCTTIATGSQVLSASQWYTFQVGADAYSTTANVTAKFYSGDGTTHIETLTGTADTSTFYTGAGASWSSSACQVILRYNTNGLTPSAAGQIYYDDIITDVSMLPSPRVIVEVLYPSSNGSYTQFTGGYGDIDDMATESNGDTLNDYVVSTTAGNKSSFNVEDTSGLSGTPVAVTHFVRGEVVVTGASTAPFFKAGASEYTADVTNFCLSTASGTHTLNTHVDGSALTLSKINDIEIGYTKNTGTGTCHIHASYLLIGIIPP